MPRLSWLFTLLVILSVFAADQLSKAWVLINLDASQIIPITSFLNVVHAHNHGAAFSFLAEENGWQRWFLSGVAFLMIGWGSFYLIITKSPFKLNHFAVVLIVSGAAGNLADRLRLGYVVDFIDLYWRRWHWPAFNLADSAIVLGVILFIYSQSVYDVTNEADESA